MSDAMVSVLEVGLSNACFAAAIAVVAWTFTKLSSNRHVAHLLWLLVLIKFVTPPLWTFPLPFARPGTSTFTALDESASAPRGSVDGSGAYPMESAARELNDRVVGETATNHTLEATSGLSHSLGWNLGPIVAWAWLASSLACVCVVLLRIWRFQQAIVAGGTTSNELANRVEHFTRLLGLRNRVRVKILDEDLPPMIWPLGRRPIMLLPKKLMEDLSNAQRDAIIVHELAHLRRRDDAVTLLEACATCLFWWNPVVWLARRQLRAAAEDCCDALVVRTLPGSRRQYGEALLRAAELLSFKESLPVLASTFGRQSSLKKRIETILAHDDECPPAAFGKMRFVAMAIFVLPIAATAMAPIDETARIDETAPIDERPSIALPHGSVERPGQAPPPSQSDFSDVLQVPSNASPADAHSEVWSMDSDGQNARKVAHVPGYPIINSPEVSPNGRFVAVDGWRAAESLTAAQLLVVDIESGNVDDLGAGAMPNWSPDGNWIAFCKYSNKPGVFVRSLDGKMERHIDPSGWGIQWSPDGWKVAYSRGSRFVVHDFVSAHSREIVPTGWDYSQIYWNPTWSPDSKEICFKARHEQGHTEFAIVSVVKDVSTVRRRISADGFDEDIAWHPDGTRILIPKAAANGVPGQIYEFDPRKADEPSPLLGQPKDRHNSGMCWSRDGKTLFFLSHN
jgi:TolB protein